MDDGQVFLALLKGSVLDPILWVFAIILGWSTDRPLQGTITFLIGAGLFWGAIRAGIYGSMGEPLTATTIASIMVVCIGLMLGLGVLVREIRWMRKDE